MLLLRTQNSQDRTLTLTVGAPAMAFTLRCGRFLAAVVHLAKDRNREKLLFTFLS
jgi:hypothetical protein